MKHLITLVLTLILMGQRWQRPALGMEATTCVNGKHCTDVSAYERVYVIGSSDFYSDFSGFLLTRGSDYVEIFTIPVPNAPLKLMTVEEAEKANKELK